VLANYISDGMGKGKLPDPLKRREILYGRDTPREALIQYGDLYRNEGRLNDAVEFYGMAGYREGLMELKEVAVQRGDFFLLQQVAGFLDDEIPPEVWRDLGRRALQEGKLSFAQKAFAQAGDLEALREVQETIKGEGEGGRKETG